MGRETEPFTVRGIYLVRTGQKRTDRGGKKRLEPDSRNRRFFVTDWDGG